MIVWTHAVLGVLYACVLSLHLFSTTEHVSHGKTLYKYIHCYYYCYLQTIINEISTSAPSSGLKISTQKTKNMLARTHPPPTSAHTNQQEVKVQENSTYCGSSISGYGETDKKLDCRVWKSSATFSQLGKKWRSKTLSLKTKMPVLQLQLVNSLVWLLNLWDENKPRKETWCLW